MTFAGLSLYLIISIIYLFLGRLNGDEGWYLYASRLVFEGNVPYRDFAYAQMPLLPYIYGLLQVAIHYGLYFGRITSIFFSFASIIFAVLIARKYGGIKACGIVAVLLATFAYGIYFNTLAKTYALTTFFFMLSFLLLSSNIRDSVKFPLAVISAILAAVTRLPALLFFIPVLIYSLYYSSRKTKFVICALCFAVFGVFIFLFVADNTESILWNLITQHAERWGSKSGFKAIEDVMFFRIPSLMLVFGPYLPMLSFAAYFFYKNKGNVIAYLKKNVQIVAVISGLMLFLGVSLLNGGWNVEYAVPVAAPLLSLMAAAISKMHTHYRNNLPVKSFLFLLLAVTFLITFGYLPIYVDLSGGGLPIEEIKNISAFVSQRSAASDRILVFEALWIAIDSNRYALPGMTMGQFSYQDVDAKKAKELKIVNYDMVLYYVKNKTAKIVILTDYDWKMLEKAGVYSANTTNIELLRSALMRNYDLILRESNFGQTPTIFNKKNSLSDASNIYIYLRRE